MKFNKKIPFFSFSVGIPPMILIGTIIVLFPIFMYMTMDRINRHKAQSIRLLLEKSTVLIRAFEAGTRTGMMNMGWGRVALENLLQETAVLPDIAYLFIVGKDGTILAHSNKKEKGKKYGSDLNLSKILESGKAKWKVKKDNNNNNVFEVCKKFSPIVPESPNMPRRMRSMHYRMYGMGQATGMDYKNTVIFVGLDMKLVEQADKDDFQHNIMMATILLLIGFTGFILVYIVQRYRSARSSLSRMKIFSDNLMENMPVGLVAMDNNERIISVNPAAQLLLKFKIKEARKGYAGHVLSGQLNDLVKAMRLKKKLVEKEIQIKDDIGKTTLLDVVVSPLVNKDGSSLGSLMILRDLTEIGQLKAEIEINKRLAAIGRLAAGVAHEIRNPLSSIKGYATFFKEIFDKESENHDIADVMIKEVDRLNLVVSELVELAKPIQMSKKPVNVKEIIIESIKLIEHDAKNKQISIDMDLNDEINDIHADQDRLKQVLLNLYLNAIQSMENSGKLSIKLSRNISQQVLIRVSDTGSGIRKEDLSDIFEPYFTTKLSGTGLGLAIVNNIIKAHNGAVDVKSEPGRGTSFTIILPAGRS
jgi:two-component system sensor histidine kinase HydH